ncbi:MAG TPA: hypothetical protein VIS48_02065 [Candidatus Kryptonia bacterium]
MQEYSSEDIRSIFRTSGDFNELFEAFRSAIEKGLNDLDAYRELFWNQTLKPEELLFFAKKLGEVFPEIGYDTYIWLSEVMNTRFDTEDTLELAFLCLKKASEFNPKSTDPYLLACELYDEDLRIPTLQSIMSFLKGGVGIVENSKVLCGRLATMYKSLGNDEMFRYYSDMAG